MTALGQHEEEKLRKNIEVSFLLFSQELIKYYSSILLKSEKPKRMQNIYLTSHTVRQKKQCMVGTKLGIKYLQEK